MFAKICVCVCVFVCCIYCIQMKRYNTFVDKNIALSFTVTKEGKWKRERERERDTEI